MIGVSAAMHATLARVGELQPAPATAAGGFPQALAAATAPAGPEGGAPPLELAAASADMPSGGQGAASGVAQWRSEITEAAESAGLPPALLAAVVDVESGGDPAAVSPAGARGLAQLMPATAASLGVDADDPVENVQGGARYLREQLDDFGSLRLALAAYNAGPGRVRAAGDVPNIAETQRYVGLVKERIDDYGDW